MKIVYHPSYCSQYAMDPAAEPGRIEAIRDVLEGRFEFLEPEPADRADLLLVHTSGHVDPLQQHDEHLYEVASLAVGGALLAARTALAGEPCFCLIRPPGHHASAGDCWGFCYFNTLAISVKALLDEGAVTKTVILDFDLHFGDGTDNIFGTDPRVVYLHPEENTASAFLERTSKGLQQARARDMIAIYAGFDRGRTDWGGLLGVDDDRRLGGPGGG